MSENKFLADRIALVTGGGRGIGRAISKALASAGATVAINYRRDENAARTTVEEIRASGGSADMFLASIDRVEQCEDLIRQVTAEIGAITILVNNAGIASRGLSVAETPSREVFQLMATHVISAHTLCRLVVPDMRNAASGDIIMISCATALNPLANGAPYTMAKVALENLAYSLAKEERENGIKVNVVAPGLVDTEMGRRLMRARAGVINIRELDDVSPYGHVCQPEEVANLVMFLVSPQNTYMTGERLAYDGGGTVDNDWY